jgi:hypothetical protein
MNIKVFRQLVALGLVVLTSSTLCGFLTLTLTMSPATAKPLAGHVEVESDESEPPPEFKEQSGVMDPGKRGKIENNPTPPAWIQGKVFSNNDMYMYSFWRLMGFKKEFRWSIPTSKKTTLFFKQDIAKHWKGEFKPTNGCTVTCVPIEGGERFKFFHKNPLGPHGYLERFGETKDGFPRYRIWFEEE